MALSPDVLLPSRPLVNIFGGRLDTLVENRVSLSHDVAELHLYETFHPARLVELQFAAPVFTSMLTGKKVIHIDGITPFDYLPGESLLLPLGKSMRIDFPEASENNPTRCMALTISTEFIQDTVATLNERFPRVEERDQWGIAENNFLFCNDPEIGPLIDRIIRLFRENNSLRQYFINLSLKELILRLMQTRVRSTLVDQAQQFAGTHRLAFLVEYIRNNLTRHLSVEELSGKACLSKAQFFRLFKNELGMTPNQFIMNERIHLAKQILGNPAKSITDACYESGFNSLPHFSSAFRAMENVSPRQFKQGMAR